MIAIVASYVYLSLEWLFFVTKPSLLNFLDGFQQLIVVLTSPLPLAILASSMSIIVFYPLSQLYRWFKKYPDLEVNRTLLFVPVFIIGGIEFILIENFTYTVFGIGVSTFTGSGRFIHTAALIGLMLYNFRLLRPLIANPSWCKRMALPLTAISVCLIVLSCLIMLIFSEKQNSGLLSQTEQVLNKPKRFDNILIFSSDGIDAEHMSAYGYERPTTPFIDTLLDESLVFENHFTNSAKTTGSVGSLLSTKHPTTTRVIFRPDIFTHIHSFQHLPGFLRQFGYTNGDVSIRHYIDSYDLNMRESFHYANGRNLDEEGLPLPKLYKQGLASTSLFLETVYERISSRLLHIFAIRTMYNPFLAVTQPDRDAGASNDRERLDRIKKFIAGTDKPFFANVHFLNTHGKFFIADNKEFTGKRKQDTPWDLDFYDNAILGYDNFTREIVEFLKQQNLLDNTLLILNTDHGFRWGYKQTLPLIMRFPGGTHTGVVKTNSQRIDIAPTIVEYLGLEIPDWMEGKSLIGLERSSKEPIYVVNRQPSQYSHGWRIVKNPKPPFYTMGSIHSIYCNRIFSLDLNTNTFSNEIVKSHTAKCSRDEIPGNETIRRDMVDYLKSQGYDVSSLVIPE